MNEYDKNGRLRKVYWECPTCGRYIDASCETDHRCEYEDNSGIIDSSGEDVDD